MEPTLLTEDAVEDRLQVDGATQPQTDASHRIADLREVSVRMQKVMIQNHPGKAACMSGPGIIRCSQYMFTVLKHIKFVVIADVVPVFMQQPVAEQIQNESSIPALLGKKKALHTPGERMLIAQCIHPSVAADSHADFWRKRKGIHRPPAEIAEKLTLFPLRVGTAQHHVCQNVHQTSTTSPVPLKRS